MLKLNDNKDILYGNLKISDGEKHLITKWLEPRSQASFYIGDKQNLKNEIYDFINGDNICFVDKVYLLKYIEKVIYIYSNYKALYHGGIDLVHILNYFKKIQNPKIILSYIKDDRYIRVLKNPKLDYNKDILLNGKYLRDTLVGAITRICIKKNKENYTLYLEIIDDWKEKIMVQSLNKANLEDIVKIFESEIDNLIISKTIETSSIVFGIKYKNLIENIKDKITLEEIVVNSKYNNKNLIDYIKKGIDIKDEISFLYEDSKIRGESNNKNDNNTRNLIIYGVPGCGKSYYLKKEYLDKTDYFKRVVFHSGYTNSDFIGQILPVVNNGQVTYQFKAGIFTEILKYSIEKPTETVILAIEELNRGDAPAIFGDVFQLLDRDDEGKSITPINNKDMAYYIFNDENKSIFIPSNLSIIATMNSSDQNVFTLDTAFKRRWNTKYINNEFNKEDEYEKELSNTEILDTNVTWSKFISVINKKMNDSLSVSSEDKRLGKHFIKTIDIKLEDNNDKDKNSKIDNFANKVLNYLYEDAFKLS